MASITILIEQTNQETVTNTYEFSDEQLDRMVGAFQDTGNSAVSRVATRNEVLTTWSEEQISATTSRIRSFEMQKALEAAVPELKELPSVVSQEKAAKIAELQEAQAVSIARQVALDAARSPRT